jgi:hypothetical protein
MLNVLRPLTKTDGAARGLWPKVAIGSRTVSPPLQPGAGTTTPDNIKYGS